MPEESFISKPNKARSRRFPCEVMFIGIVCPPVRDDNERVVSDRKIMLKRVSKQVEQKQQSYNQRFVSHYLVNHKLKEGEWKKLFPEKANLSTDEFILKIKETYNIEDDIADNLVFTYDGFSVTKKTGMPKHKFMLLREKWSCPWKLYYKV